jgi:DNA-binding response OmpR family regulator
MPRMGGRELLRTLKEPDSQWLTIPVIVLTTSSAEDDVLGSYQDHANAYVTKALNYDAFQARPWRSFTRSSPGWRRSIVEASTPETSKHRRRRRSLRQPRGRRSQQPPNASVTVFL